MSKVADEIAAQNPGARFHRADLHIHSYGSSHDVIDPLMTPDAIVEKALAEGLGIIAITDHNDISNVKSGLAAGEARSVCVVPGIELTTPEGHLLAYFESFDDLSEFYGKLVFVDKGKKDSRCQTSLLDCLTQVGHFKGFGILAHIDVENGFEQKLSGYPPHKGDIIAHPSLLGLEIKAVDAPFLYSNLDLQPERRQMGERRRKSLKLGEAQQLARVSFSDSHTLAGIGKNLAGTKRVTRIKMDSPSFQALRIALFDADARVRLEEQVPLSVAYVKGIKLQGGFLDGQTIHFSRNLNCIIGGRGTGKSTTFEAVRSLCPPKAISPLINSEIWPEILVLVWVDQAGAQHTVIRRIHNEPENLTHPEVGCIFPIESFGQNETAQTSVNSRDNPAVLLDYLDRFISFQRQKTDEEDIRGLLLENQTEIEKATSWVGRIPEYRRLQSQTQQQLSTLKSANASDIVELEQKIAEENGLRELITTEITDLSSKLKSTSLVKDLSIMDSEAEPVVLKVGALQYENIISLTKKFHLATSSTEASLSKEIDQYWTNVKAELETWKAEEVAMLARIDEKRALLLAKGIRLDHAFIKKVVTDDSSYRLALKKLATWETKLKELQGQRKELLTRRRNSRSAIFNTRNAYAIGANTALQSALGDLIVSVKFLESALSPEGGDLIRDAMKWRTSQVPKAQMLVEQVTISGLLMAIQKTDPAPILRVIAKDGQTVFSREEALELLEVLKEPSILYRLERCFVDDLPVLKVTKRVERNGKTEYLVREFAKLSLGQQQSVLLALMLSCDSELPLLIDQPEDNLDSEFIFNSLVPVLRAAKERRQIIIVTHNANIAVLGDAEQIIVLKSTSEKSVVVAQGSIDNPATKLLTCRVLEGSEEAFRRRGKMYGILNP